MKNKELAHSTVWKGHDPLEGKEQSCSKHACEYSHHRYNCQAGSGSESTVGLQARETGLLAHEMP